MKRDEALQESYLANIAMRLWDRSKLSRNASQDAAQEIMDLLFLK